MSDSFDLIIVGAGIVGAACALECARAGMKILVMERGRLADGTTGAGMGHVVVMDDSEAQLALTACSRRLWQAIGPELPPEAEYDRCGTLWVALDDEEMAEARRKEEAYGKHGINAQVVKSDGIAELEPNLHPGLIGGLFVPDDIVVDPVRAARFLLERAKARGVVVRTGAEVNALLAQGGVRLPDSSRIAAGKTLNATGAWAAQLTPGLPLRKRKGYLVAVESEPGFAQRQIVELGYFKSVHSIQEDSVAFNVQPRRSGRLLIGSSQQFDVPDSSVDQAIVESMIQRAFEFMPGLAQFERKGVSSGQRAATPDRLPLIGPSLVSDKIWLATGHEGLGITTSLATGRLVADLLLGRPTEIPAAPYSPARFAKARK